MQDVCVVINQWAWTVANMHILCMHKNGVLQSKTASRKHLSKLQLNYFLQYTVNGIEISLEGRCKLRNTERQLVIFQMSSSDMHVNIRKFQS